MNRIAILAVVLATFVSEMSAVAQEPRSADQQGENTMNFVTGIGGFFFRSENPEALAKWYHENLGIELPPTSYDGPVWRQEAGTTVFAPFAKNTEMFGDPEKQFMLNFRVRDLDGLVEYLRKNGAKVEIDPETYPNGRFATTQDPEGNPIQLWEPDGKDPG